MSKNLVIVESPTKAKTISRFLGKDYVVKSSYGHLRDLPKSKIGVDIDKNFEPQYVVPKDSQKTVSGLSKLAKSAKSVILASDEDREGEAIAWHLISALKLPLDKIKRITFHEITRPAIEEAIKHPRKIDQNLVDAQQARRVLDRLVGYKLSPLLWKKVAYGLSAGRVQSVALRLIVEREREREKFKKQEYWTVEADFKTKTNEILKTKLQAINNKSLKKFDLHSKTQIDKLLKNLPKTFEIKDIQAKEVIKKPLAPFTTSTLQQAANRKFGYSARQIMRLAQQLYEGLPLDKKQQTGLITYMRTDSVTLAKNFKDAAKTYIQNTYGSNYLPAKSPIYTAKSKLAQEAHEAIRPTNPMLTPEIVKPHLDSQQYKLYQLIWQRALASQMSPAKLKQAAIDISSSRTELTFRAGGQIMLFIGFLKVWPADIQETILPEVKLKETITLEKTKPEQHFTEPPARFSDAGLVKTLEEHGIGRPSTYAPTIATIINRKYAEREQRRLKPTDMAFLVNDLLVNHFTNIVDYKFTAEMEDSLDKIAQGKSAWQPIIKNFYEPFEKNIMTKDKELSKKELTEEKTDDTCPKCGKELIIKMGRFGKFFACSGYPECKYTAQLDKENGQKKEEEKIEEKCPQCNHDLVKKHGRFGEFIGCSNYPECKYILSLAEKLNISCPECDKGEMVIKKTRRGKPFYACNQYPTCQFALWQKPINKNCPECKSLLVYAAKEKIKCSNNACKYTEDAPED